MRRTAGRGAAEGECRGACRVRRGGVRCREERRVMVTAMMMLMAGDAECSLTATSSYVLTLTTIVCPVGFLMGLFYR